MGLWYGVQPAWWAPLERDARHRFDGALRHTYAAGRLIYEVKELDVVGARPLDVRISFFEHPPYDTYGLQPSDFPRVHANPGAASKHRYPQDDALCLWHPYDPEEHRWTSENGLLDLIEVVRTHLFLEHYWRLTGGAQGGRWLVRDAPHGLPGSSAWRSSRPRRRRAAGHGHRPLP